MSACEDCVDLVYCFHTACLLYTSALQRFFYITLPSIRPILAYTLITSIIGGLQMFDVPQILTNGQGKMCIRDSDEAWNTTYGNKQRTAGGQIYF